jgi:hypothetical protein
MTAIRWKDGSVISLRLKTGDFALGQLMKFPYIAFLDAFSATDEWKQTAVETARVLFYCAVTKQFLQMSDISIQKSVRPAQLAGVPTRWIKRFPGSRMVTVWKGARNERTFLDMSERPGGQLVEQDLTAPVSSSSSRSIIQNEIRLDDNTTIDSHELDVIEVYPYLNERLLLCMKLGRNIDPGKDILFDRELPPECEDYVNMRSRHGTPEDYGYKSPKKKA